MKSALFALFSLLLSLVAVSYAESPQAPASFMDRMLMTEKAPNSASKE
jgi:hypothetical protein